MINNHIQGKNGFPSSWFISPIGDCVNVIKGKKPKKLGDKSAKLQIPYITIKAFETKNPDSFTDGEKCRICNKYDTLIVWDGARCGLVGKGIGGAVGSTLAKIECESAIPNFLYYFLQSRYNEINSNPRGVGIPHVDPNLFYKIEFPLPPLPEQGRIVEKIETLFSELDAGVAALKRAQANLKRYKASLLKAACEGRLVPTEAELAHQEDCAYEPADVLLERILTERRAKWEAEEWDKLIVKAKKETAQKQRKGAGLPSRLSDLQEDEWQDLKEEDYTSYLPKSDTWKNKYKTPKAPITEELPELPEGWVWGTVGQIANVGTGATPLRNKSDYWKDGTIPWVKSGALNNEFVDNAEEFVTEKALGETNISFFPSGSLLIAMYGEGKTRGKVSELTFPATTNQAIAGIVFDDSSLTAKNYLKVFFTQNYENIRSLSSGGVQPNLNLTIIKTTNIPLPPLKEQNRIALAFAEKLSLIQKQEIAIEKDIIRSTRLRQSILKRAFEGKLVPQYPNDEPASELLTKISNGILQ